MKLKLTKTVFSDGTYQHQDIGLLDCDIEEALSILDTLNQQAIKDGFAGAYRLLPVPIEAEGEHWQSFQFVNGTWRNRAGWEYHIRSNGGAYEIVLSDCDGDYVIEKFEHPDLALDTYKRAAPGLTYTSEQLKYLFTQRSG